MALIEPQCIERVKNQFNLNQIAINLGPRILRYFSVSFPREIALDLTQEALIRLVAKAQIDSPGLKEESLTCLAYGIARLVRMEQWKRSTREILFAKAEDYDFRTQESAYDDPEIKIRTVLRLAIGELSEIQCQVVLLHIDEELTLVEIAQILGISAGTVKSHIHRAKKNLKKIIAQMGENYGF